MSVLGCAASTTNSSNLRTVSNTPYNSATQAVYGPSRLTLPEIRSEVMSFADNYVAHTARAMDELAASTHSSEVAQWALRMKIAAAMNAFNNAGGPNEVVGLLDTLVMVTLKREALEEYWIPTLLHDEGAGVLKSYRDSEKEAWELGSRVLTQHQIDELHTLIDQWRKDNPGEYYVGNIHFAEFAADRRISADSPQAKRPGSLFGLFYLDPLANLDPVAQELRNYRALTERMLFIAERFPLVVGWQAEYAIAQGTSTPQMVQFVSATDRFATAAQKYPQDLSVERKAAIEQISDEMTKQRQALWQDFDQHEAKLRRLISESQQLVERADHAGTSINTQTTKTVAITQQASINVLRYAFVLCLILILVTFFCVVIVIFIYASRNANQARKSIG
jgi:hypothetical protein